MEAWQLASKYYQVAKKKSQICKYHNLEIHGAWCPKVDRYVKLLISWALVCILN